MRTSLSILPFNASLILTFSLAYEILSEVDLSIFVRFSMKLIISLLLL